MIIYEYIVEENIYIQTVKKYVIKEFSLLYVNMKHATKDFEHIYVPTMLELSYFYLLLRSMLVKLFPM